MNIVISNEIESDFQAISEITRAAFESNPHSNGTEEFIINALRDANRSPSRWWQLMGRGWWATHLSRR